MSKEAMKLALEWQQAPIKTQWGDDMVVASVAIDNNHTVNLYCERDQTPKVDAMFAQRKPLTDEQVNLFINGRGDEDDDDYVEPTGDGFGLTDADLVRLVRRVEAAHGIKGNT